MAPIDDVSACIADLRQWAIAERQRAAADAAVAARYEQEAARSPASAGLNRLKWAAMHRRAAACHEAAARLHERHAARLKAQLDKAESTVFRPGFAKATAAVLGMPSTAIVLLDGQQAIAVLAASDATAREAHDLEAMMGEGPVHALAGMSTPIRVEGPAVRDRWPRYGPAVTELGVQAVLAVPLLPAGGLGALCAYTRQPAITDNTVAAAGRVATSLARAMLRVPYLRDTKGDSALQRFGLTDDQAVVHQAAGMVSIQCDCSINDAMALLRARAFANGQPVEQLAVAVVHDGLRLS
ncbi:MAG TPA: GAF and ANTAR domain-containing protein [Trebonia sp.]